MSEAAEGFSFTPFPVLESKRLLLRQLTRSDADAVFQIRSDERVNEYLQRNNYNDVKEAVAFIDKINTDIAANKSVFWAITLQGDAHVAGTICLWNLDAPTSCGEIGYELHPNYQGKGIMQEAYDMVVDYAFNVLGLQKLIAVTDKKNTRSVRLLMKNGFSDPIPLQENGEVVPDMLVYQLNKND